MTELAAAFVGRLQLYKKERPGAIAALRHSLAFAPGSYSKAWPYVEPFLGGETGNRNSRRLALYTAAGLFARNPRHQSTSFARSFGVLWRLTESDGIQSRFVALLAADAENIAVYLRHAASLLEAKELGCDYIRLIDDLSCLMNPACNPFILDQIRQRWAADFYRADSDHSTIDTESFKG